MSIRHSRQDFLGDKSQEVLASSRIGIVGLCGGGSHVAQQLAHTGVGNIVAADFDHVEDPNLNRMVGSCPGDARLRRPKPHVIRDLILRINPEARVEIAGRWQESGDLLRTCDIVIGCVDSFTARDELEKFCRRFMIPYIDIGMDVHCVANGFGISGQVALSMPGGHCLWCNGILTTERLKQEQQNYGAAGGKPQVIWPNGVLASIAVGHAVSLLLPWNSDLPLPSLIQYDGNRHITRPGARLQFLKDVPCPHYSGEGEIGDPFFSVTSLNFDPTAC
ncbi:HesA/MoeB/ThiF family protein [Noviherbaspirillum malthae]|uniref:HesA/MoeB/ThiF family protein n=1 Tax=Noviherbaspirillum malthae TaxID=1260987 RepID=UPI0018909458|nr:ThiF family adenylyltransferase [Noviherbaspirillum malthae]